jgi:hypothetical protein
VEFYLNNQLIGTSQVNDNTPLVDIAASIKQWLDTTSNKMNTFAYEFRYFVPNYPALRTPTMFIGAIIPQPPPVTVLVPADLMVPEFRIYTIRDLSNKVPQGPYIKGNSIRIDLKKSMGLGALTPNNIVDDTLVVI